MPTLLVLRHGKSDWDAPFDTDADRPLSDRGRRAAATIGRFLAATGSAPDLALTSPARRAHDTLDRAIEAGGWACEVRVVDRLYGHGAAAVIDELRSLGAGPETVLVAGHEPTSSSLIAGLTGGHVRFPTAALARIDLSGGWEHVGAGRGELAWLVTPRLLQAATEPDPDGS